MSYKSNFPIDLASVHPALYVSLLKKCSGDLTLVVPLDNVGMKYILYYGEVPVKIFKYIVSRLRNKEFVLMKVLWRNLLVKGVTREVKVNRMAKCPNL